MRQAFAHDAVVTMEADGDIRAPGAAITLALCGHWEHDPPCPLAPHHTDAQHLDDQCLDQQLNDQCFDHQRDEQHHLDHQRLGHQSRGDRPSGNQVRLRVLFAAEPSAEADVRRRIETALSQASLTGPDGRTTYWQLHSAQPGLLRPDEAQHAERLIQS